MAPLNPLLPFKTKPVPNPMEMARLIFGDPVEVCYSNLHPTTKMKWVFEEGAATARVQVAGTTGNDSLDIHFSLEFSEQLVPVSPHCPPEAIGKLERFVGLVRKPWEQWTEEEIMENPMWVCLYKEQNGDPTPAMHAMMAMESYARPNNKWVRRYFDGV
jgi:hypothetical protein